MGTMQGTHDPKLLEVRHLKLVRAVADSGGVTRAANVLHLSQSAVSHQLLALERDLGARLFDRVGKRMVPTAMGAHLALQARRLLGELCDLERSMDGTREARIPLRIVSSCYTSYSWLPAALSHFAATHPLVELDIVIEATRRTTAALAADEVDVAIVTDPPRDDIWAREVIIASELVAVAAKRHPITKRLSRGALRWGALHDFEILVPDIADHDLARLDEAVRRSWQRESGHRQSQPIAVRKVPVSDALLELARSGAGVAILDRWTVPAQRAGLAVLPLMPPAPRVFSAVWRRSNPRELPIADLVAIARATATKAVKPGR